MLLWPLYNTETPTLLVVTEKFSLQSPAYISFLLWKPQHDCLKIHFPINHEKNETKALPSDLFKLKWWGRVFCLSHMYLRGTMAITDQTSKEMTSKASFCNLTRCEKWLYAGKGCIKLSIVWSRKVPRERKVPQFNQNSLWLCLLILDLLWSKTSALPSPKTHTHTRTHTHAHSESLWTGQPHSRCP